MYYKKLVPSQLKCHIIYAYLSPKLSGPLPNVAVASNTTSLVIDSALKLADGSRKIITLACVGGGYSTLFVCLCVLPQNCCKIQILNKLHLRQVLAGKHSLNGE